MTLHDDLDRVFRWYDRRYDKEVSRETVFLEALRAKLLHDDVFSDARAPVTDGKVNS